MWFNPEAIWQPGTESIWAAQAANTRIFGTRDIFSDP